MRKACWEWGVVVPDRAEQSASLGEGGEAHNFRKQSHQPVLRGSGGGGAEVWGSRALGPRSIELLWVSVKQKADRDE